MVGFGVGDVESSVSATRDNYLIYFACGSTKVTD
jgi:hypothetical protein